MLEDTTKATEMVPELDASAAECAASGMGSRIFGGSMWTIGAQGTYLLTSFVTTPFVIRLLGTDDYGLLTLINLLIGYLGFADLGMGTASTRFGAEALARGDRKGESAVVWTSILVTSLPALAFAALLIFGGGFFTSGIFELPVPKQATAADALRIAAVILLATAATGVFNTPQLARLRVGLNSTLTMSGSIAQACVVLLVLYLGGSLLGVVTAMACVSLALTCLHLVVSARLAPEILRPRFDEKLVRPLLRFGFGMVATALTGTIVVHGEKFLLVRLASVADLAYYNVAFTFAGLLGVLPAALVTPLMPSFVHLNVANEKERLSRLYNGVLRGLIFWTVPAALALCVIARPFFTLWAGPEFGKQSTLPLCILALAWLLNSVSYIPRCVLYAWNQVGVVARYQVYELVPYALAVVLLVSRFGIAGAAVAWGLRVALECYLVFRAVRRLAGLSPAPLAGELGRYGTALGALFLPVLIVLVLSSSRVILVSITTLSVLVYGSLVFVRVLRSEERSLLTNLLSRIIRQ
jgi:O-antigen/teichoic acid export membrane protein